MKFSEFKLNEKLRHEIAHKKYEEASEIQEKTIPLVLAGKDIIAQSQTGTGKTAAFAIPLLERLMRNEIKQVLVLVPTRELAVQVQAEFHSLSRGQGIYSLAVYGGQSINMQREKIQKGLDVIVATPGRLIDLMDRGWIYLDSIGAVVLDEADKMFDMGFRKDIDYILSACPYHRQTMLFSATISQEIMSLAQKHMMQERIFLDISRDNMSIEEIEQFYVCVDQKRRVDTLAKLIAFKKMKKCLVFCGTQRTADWLSREMYKRRIDARSIHGGLSQSLRKKILDSFKSGKTPVLIGTDLVARGLHIDDISHVINFDFPREHETYVHRIGRTARFGKNGEAITFCTSRAQVIEIEKISREINAEIVELIEN